PRRRGRAAGAGIRGRATREFVDSGGLLSYAAHYPDLYRRAAVYVDKIFKGEKPADLPIEQPAKFEMMVSLKAAKAARLPPRTHCMLHGSFVIRTNRRVHRFCISPFSLCSSFSKASLALRRGR